MVFFVSIKGLTEVNKKSMKKNIKKFKKCVDKKRHSW